MITDAMMSQAAALLAEAINNSLPAPYECAHDYSAGFERKIKRLMRKVDHPVRHRMLRAAASILLIIFIGFGAVLSISAEAREIVFGWVRHQCGSFYDYFFVGENCNATQAKYYPNWIPNDCTFLASYETSGGEVHSAVLSGRWCGDQRPLCGPAAGDCQSVEFGFITTV